jgi:transcriptional regulator with GAF, ATPase, and Fis domain
LTSKQAAALFMDEIENLPLDLQAKFMRAFAGGRSASGGKQRDPQSQRADHLRLELVAARLVDKENFAVTFYRLHVYPIYVPLADRGEVPCSPTIFNQVCRRTKEAPPLHFTPN